MVLDEFSDDRLIWTPSAWGHFSFKLTLNNYIPEVLIWKALWRVLTPLKVKTFLWLLLKHRLPLRERLHRFQMISTQENTCLFCGISEETLSHLFLHCSQVFPLWYQVASYWEVSLVCLSNFLSFFDIWLHTVLLASKIVSW